MTEDNQESLSLVGEMTPTTDYSTVPSRPIRTKETLYKAAENVIDQLIEEGKFLEKDRQETISHIVEYCDYFNDGYKNCKSLDCRAGWDCDIEIVDVIDCYSTLVDKFDKEEQKLWVEKYNIQPQFLVGTRVSIGRGETGEITGIYHYSPACYEIKIDNDKDAETKKSRRIVKFEDAKLEIITCQPLPEHLADGHKLYWVNSARIGGPWILMWHGEGWIDFGVDEVITPEKAAINGLTYIGPAIPPTQMIINEVKNE